MEITQLFGQLFFTHFSARTRINLTIYKDTLNTCGYACKDSTKKLSEVEQSLEYSGKVGMHTLDKLVETQIKFLLKSMYAFFSYYLKEFMCFQSILLCTMKVPKCPQFDFFVPAFNDVGNANWSLVIHCLTVQSNDSFAVAATFTMGSEEL